MKTETHNFSVGICAFNEADNIGRLLKSIFDQHLGRKYVLKEVIVIASGCTDETENIVRSFAKIHPKVKLVSEKKRLGKARAVNTFIAKAASNFLILQSADTLTSNTCYRFLLDKLESPNTGLAAGKVVPLDSINDFLGFANSLKWQLHHMINVRFPERPKVGELIAFKKIFNRIPPETAVDEASIEPLIHLQGFSIAYEPRAIIYNSGPKTLREYLSTRRRIYAGHLVTKKKYAYEIITFSALKIMPVFLNYITHHPKHIPWSIIIVFLEIVARVAGHMDIVFKKRSHTVWKVAASSKKLT